MKFYKSNLNLYIIIVVQNSTVVPNFRSFRYIRWNITALKGGTSGTNAQTMQASEFELLVGSTKFSRPSGTTASTNATQTGNGETVDKLIDGSTSTKFCPNGLSWTRPLYAQIDLGSKVNLKTITNWRRYNGNDTATYNVRNPNSGNIQVSKDGTTWRTISVFTTTESKSDSNYAVAYTGTINWNL